MDITNYGGVSAAICTDGVSKLYWAAHHSPYNLYCAEIFEPSYVRVEDTQTEITSSSQDITVPSSAFEYNPTAGIYTATIKLCNVYVDNVIQSSKQMKYSESYGFIPVNWNVDIPVQITSNSNAQLTIAAKKYFNEDVTVTNLGSMNEWNSYNIGCVTYGDNKIWAIRRSTGKVRYYDLETKEVTQVYNGESSMNLMGLAYAGAEGYLYAGCDTLMRFNINSPSSGWTQCWSQSSSCLNNIYYNRYIYSYRSSNKLSITDAATGELKNTIENFGIYDGRRGGIYDGCLYAIPYNANKPMYSYNIETGTIKTYANTLTGTDGCILQGKIHKVTNTESLYSIYRCNIDGTNYEKFLDLTNYGELSESICTDGVSKLYWVSSNSPYNLYCADFGWSNKQYSIIAGSNQQDITSDTNSDPQDITIPSSAFVFDPNTEIYTANIVLHNVEMESITQAEMTKTIKSIKTNHGNESILVVADKVSTSNGTGYVKIGNNSWRQVNGRTVLTINPSDLTEDSGMYSVDLFAENGYDFVKAAISYDEIDIVDDLIDFNAGNESKNGILSTTVRGTNDSGYFRMSDANLTISSLVKGKLSLTYAGAFANDIALITEVIDQLTVAGGYYNYIKNLGSSYILLNAKIILDALAWYPYSLENSTVLDWRDSTVFAPTGIGIAGSYSKYGDGAECHLLNTDLCSPKIYAKYQEAQPFASDASVVFDSRTSILADVTLSDKTYDSGDTYISGTTRLFSQFKRNSANQHIEIKPHSTTYDDKAKLVETTFTVPVNMALRSNGYQEETDTPTQGAAKATIAACQKLKDTYGDNLRVYVIKYRPQSWYNTIPAYDMGATQKDQDYSIVDSCASGTATPYLYDISTKAELENALTAIAKDIKENFAGYTDAKAFNVEQ